MVTVVTLARMDVFEGLSPKLIASELNAEGIPNHNGRRWDTQSIHRILTNHHYVGEVEYQGAVYEGEHDGIVEQIGRAHV